MRGFICFEVVGCLVSTENKHPVSLQGSRSSVRFVRRAKPKRCTKRCQDGALAYKANEEFDVCREWILKSLTLQKSTMRSRYFFKRSRISINSSWSFVGAGGAAGVCASFLRRRFIPLTTMKMAKAMMVKSKTVWMKVP